MEDTCLECRQLISDSVFCECEMCGRKIHGSCAKLSTIDVKFLRSISKTFLGGLCQVCRGEIRLLPKLYRRFRELEETFENNYLSLTAMDDRINCDKLVLVSGMTIFFRYLHNQPVLKKCLLFSIMQLTITLIYINTRLSLFQLLKFDFHQRKSEK